MLADVVGHGDSEVGYSGGIVCGGVEGVDGVGGEEGGGVGVRGGDETVACEGGFHE